jgi:hypothetical protein
MVAGERRQPAASSKAGLLMPNTVPPPLDSYHPSRYRVFVQSSTRGTCEHSDRLAPPVERLEVLEKRSECFLVDRRFTVIAARGLLVPRRRVIDAKDVVQQVPHVAAGSMARLTFPYVQQYHAWTVFLGDRWLSREGETISPIKMYATDNCPERTRQSICLEGRVAGIALEEPEAALKARPPSCKSC